MGKRRRRRAGRPSLSAGGRRCRPRDGMATDGLLLDRWQEIEGPRSTSPPANIGAMDCLRRLFRREPDAKDGKYERVACDACQGTGLASPDAGAPAPARPIVDSDAAWVSAGSHATMSTPKFCGRCHGRGWLKVKRQPSAARHEWETSLQNAAALDGASGAAHGEPLQDEQTRPPSLPLHPLPPRLRRRQGDSTEDRRRPRCAAFSDGRLPVVRLRRAS